ncbi:hypothetical protein FQY83_13000 [Luteimonas marina]|uniref:Uncharacterized protein n=1 Tax=Luteimonas marina TaxID=488485 RepID=A0A5C5U0R1_9GAMM|nr:hypothetical protein [Luteimonas marina]TWT19268.1 hypothetical protein FQY83_13000 [Luteimonas marina]
MPGPRRLLVFLRSLLALVLAIAAIPAVNLAGSWLSSHVFGLGPGGTLRLAVDLSWMFVAGFAGAWLMVKTAAIARAAHAWALFAIYLVAAMYAAITMRDDFPHWFTLGLLASIPAQVWLGWWLARGRSRP